MRRDRSNHSLVMHESNDNVDCSVDLALTLTVPIKSPINRFNPRYTHNPSRVQASASLFHLNNLKDIKEYCASLIKFLIETCLFQITRGLCLCRNSHSHPGALIQRLMIWTAMVLAQLPYIFSARLPTKTIRQTGILDNKKLILAVLISFGLQMAVVYVPGQTPHSVLRHWVEENGLCWPQWRRLGCWPARTGKWYRDEKAPG